MGKIEVRVKAAPGGFHSHQPAIGVSTDVGIKAIPLRDGSELVVIQPGPAQPGIVHDKTHGPNEVQMGPRIGAQADDAAGILGNLRPIEHDMQLLFPH